MTRHRFRAFAPDAAANAAIEFALLVPVMLLIFGAMAEFGRAFQVYGAVNRLATRYALAWADCSDSPAGTCNTELATYTATPAIGNLVPQLTNAVTLRMLQVQMTSSPTVNAASPSGATPTQAELAALQDAVPSGQTGVVVTVTYTHTLTLFPELVKPFFGTSRIFTSTVAQLKS